MNMARQLRVALVGGDREAQRELAAGLGALGHEVVALGGAPIGPLAALETGLRWRGFTDSLTELPFALRALRAGGYDLAHAFSPAAAQAALLWRRRTRRPVVFTCPETLDRSRVADRRLRLDLLAAAVERSNAVTVTTDEARAALWRWMAVEAELIAPRDAAAHAALYGRLLSPR